MIDILFKRIMILFMKSRLTILYGKMKPYYYKKSHQNTTKKTYLFHIEYDIMNTRW